VAELTDQAAIVTGAGRGIGLAIAERLLQAGARVMLADLDGESVAREAARLGSAAAAYQVDVTDEDGVQAMIAAACGQFGRLDILVNNAAITGKSSVPHGGPILDIPVAQWRRMLDVNLTGAFICAKYAGTEMARAGQGAIVNIASIQGVYATRHSGDYSTAKAGLIMLTRVLAGELAEFGIRVNAVAPGPIDTDLAPDSHSPARTTATLLGRAGTPAEIAEAVLFLVSPRGSFVDGELLMVDGGAGIRFRTPPRLEGGRL
jgi:NAD(P)-dependent dehydrogenase (short-subunit alcohol dehydrogenase family)